MDSLSDEQQQAEEMEAVASIYGNDLHYEDGFGSKGRNFSIILFPKNETQISFFLPPGYPTKESPRTTLIAPSLRGEPRKVIERKLQETAERSLGQCCLFQLAEEARDLVTQAGIQVEPLLESSVKSAAASEENMHPENASVLPLLNHEIFHGRPFTERKSTFQAHVAAVRSVTEVHAIVDELKRNRKIADATHNIMAYRIEGPGQSVISDCDDDGELQAGARLLHLLNILDVKNKVVVVSRWFGGVLLGPERFKHISNAARDLLVQHT
ncbi:protein IMPACT-like [Paramacrobiotus metropolitanus]|uniref:protein IMPACT-like n=1 Tax=Paramacrobiotus metropolitanus TaxID=2943436 RepID=UPI0024462C54|nr:protein IMPACT-like [Paramacrobiotus metropolitanus]